MSIVPSDDHLRLSRLERLSQLTGDMMRNLGTMQLDDHLKRIAEAALEVLEAETCSILLVKDKDDRTHGKELILKATAGSVSRPVRIGHTFPIESRRGGGLTSHIAAAGNLFREHGNDLKQHFAVAHGAELESCYSLIALPLKKTVGAKEELVGLLRADNKKNAKGKILTDRGFGPVDEWLIKLFGDAAVVAIENAEWVHYRKNLISSCPSGIIAVDRDGKVTEYNERAGEILGKTKDMVLHKPVADLYFEPSEPRKIGSLLHKRKGRVINYVTSVRGPGGEAIPIRHSATWLWSGDQRIGSVGYFEDLREQQRHERREKLLQVINDIAKANNLRDGLQQFVETMSVLLDRTYCAVLLADDRNRFLTLVAASRADRPAWRPPSDARLLIDSWPGVRQLLAETSPTERTWEDEQFRAALRALSKLMAFDVPMRTLRVVPLRIEDRVIAQIHLGERRAEGRAAFDLEEEQQLIDTIAAQMAVLTDRLRLVDQTEQREKRLTKLTSLIPALRAEAGTKALLRDVARLAAELVDYEIGGVFVRNVETNRFELSSVEGLPLASIGMQAEDGCPILEAANAKATIEESSFSITAEGPERIDLAQVYAVPMRPASGDVEAVLFVANKETRDGLDTIDRNMLERFAVHAAAALRTSRHLHDNQRLAGRLEILHLFSDYILQSTDEDEMYHAFLTGVTASYGLRFNRAFLLLADDLGKRLEGARGIGEIEGARAHEAWHGDDTTNLSDFRSYLELLKAGRVQLSTVDKLIKGVWFALDNDDIFVEVMKTKHVRVVPQEEIPRLPELFLNRFNPTSQLVIVPLVGRDGKALGLLVVDNKFTHALIDESLLKALSAFASTVAIAIDNRKLLRETQRSEQALLALAEMSSRLTAMDQPDRILYTLGEAIGRIAGAWGVTLLRYDATTERFPKPLTFGDDRGVAAHDIIRPNGFTMEVMRTGKAVRIEDVKRALGDVGNRIHPRMLQRGIQAALCLPLSTPRNRLGAIWLHYDRPMKFSDSLVNALQLVVNQGAVAYEQAKVIEAQAAIRRADESLNQREGVAEIVRCAVENACRLFNAKIAILLVYDAQGDSFLPERSANVGLTSEQWDSMRDSIRPPSTSRTAKEVMSGNWIAVADVTAEPQRDWLDPQLVAVMKDAARGFQGMALKVGAENVGVLYTLHQMPLYFSEDLQLIASEFANDIAWALKKALLLETVSRTKAAAKVVAEAVAAGYQNREQSMTAIAEQVKEALNCANVVLFDFDATTNELSHPARSSAGVPREILEHPDEKKDYDLVMSILKRDEPRTVSKVLEDPDFQHRRFVEKAGIRSCAAVPLKAGDNRVGVMFVNYQRDHDFSQEEIADIKLFASQAAVAIQAAQLFDSLLRKIDEQMKLVADLRAAQDLADARTLLAWMGLRVLDWSHDLNENLTNVTNLLSLIRPVVQSHTPDLLNLLQKVAEAVGSFRRPPARQLGKPTEDVFDVQTALLAPFVERVTKVHDPVVITLHECAETVEIQANVEWLTRVLTYLVKNAAFALRSTEGEKKIDIGVRKAGAAAQIYVTDNGPGVPDDMRSRLFIGPIEHDADAEGLGIGLWITQTVLTIFNGSIERLDAEPRGTTMMLSLPIARQRQREMAEHG
ncbi:MAG TPA: GAF domain-containing protein [Thermoanaerobaculia bacterium]|nr:GAF domain-containing protein [Thermoanaerobaculia bacterium]